MLIRNKSIREKFLVSIATTSILTSLITTVVIGIFDWTVYKSRWINDLNNQALLIGRSSIPALQFNDPTLAARNLALLEVRPRIHSAAIYNEKGNIYASYKGAKYPLQILPEFKNNNIKTFQNEITVSARIEQNGDLIGYILLTADYELEKRLITYLGILILVGGLAYFISRVIARWLQNQITLPIENIAALAKKVVDERDYSIRAEKTTDDEVGYLVNAFNTMLYEIQKANQAQQNANEQLEMKVIQRTEELNKSQYALLQSQKLEAVGKLTGGIAHDFNNILQVIGSNLEILLMKYSTDEFANQKIYSGLAAVERGAKLASQLLAFARRQPLQPVPTNLNNLTRHLDDLLRRALGESIEIEIINGGALWNVMVDRNQMENVILNLSINARDAMNNNGHLTIETSNVMLDDLYAENAEDVIAGQYVLLAISDTGCGMTPEIIEKAFEPFFTTKSEGKGTGLGLSMAYGVVKQSGGNIKIYSEVGHGTTIKIYLPRVNLPEIDIPVKKENAIPGGKESILVVEDDMAVQTAVASILKNLGYAVQTASDAQSGLDIIKSGQKFDLLFTDVVMPGPLKSLDLAKQAKILLPNIAVLYTSGYTQNAIVHGGKLDAGVDLINKPYRQADLARKIRMVLEKANREATSKSTELSSLPNLKIKGSSKIKILVVEDNSESNATLCELLTLLDYEAVGVATAEIALNKIQDVDILFTDINLPGMSGVDLAIQSHRLNSSRPIIISSGMDMPIPFDFEIFIMPKPFSLNTLNEVLDKIKNLLH